MMNLYEASGIRYWYAPPTIATPSPIVLFLHGSGERGSNPTDVLKWGLPKAVHCSAQETRFHLVAPQCPAGLRWRDVSDAVVDVLHNVRQSLAQDAPLIAMGFSMGGQGVLEMAAAHKGLFQAILAVAPRNTDHLKRIDYKHLAQTSVFVIHGKDDPIVPVSDSQSIAEAILHEGGNPTLRILAGRNHFIADEVFAVEEFHQILSEMLDVLSSGKQRRFGSAKDIIHFADDFEEPLEDFVDYR